MRPPIDIVDIAQDFASASSPAMLFDRAARHFALLGVDHFTFGGSTSAKLGVQAINMGVNLYHSTLPAGAVERVGGANRFGNDYSVRRLLEGGKDLFWTDPAQWQGASAAERAHFAAINEAGFRLGYTGVLSRAPGYYTGVGLHLDAWGAADLNRHWNMLRPQLMFVASALDSAFARSHLPAHFALSPREKDTLAWLALGLRTEDIADRWGISYGTVDKYIISARQKLNARTRDHAVARALVLGLINL